MISLQTAAEIALALPGTAEQLHWGRPAFTVNKKIFATLWPVEKRAVLMLSVAEQSVFTQMDKNIFFPVDGGWGKRGATFVDLTKVSKKLFREVSHLAWASVTQKKSREI